jgi:NADP-dependent 3-hydroxy acid dehydrogenase YdfG
LFDPASWCCATGFTSEFPARTYQSSKRIAASPRVHGIYCCLHPGNVQVERRQAGSKREDDEPMMSIDEIARVAVLIASLPAHVNMLETIVLPVGQAYLGRG